MHKGPVEPILDALLRIGMEGRPVDETLRKADIPRKDRGQWRTFLLSGAALLLGIPSALFYPGEPLARLPFLASILARRHPRGRSAGSAKSGTARSG